MVLSPSGLIQYLLDEQRPGQVGLDTDLLGYLLEVPVFHGLEGLVVEQGCHGQDELLGVVVVFIQDSKSDVLGRKVELT